MGKQGSNQSDGVRGPGGPPPVPAKSGAKGSPRRPANGSRSALEGMSYPLLVTLQRVPRWVMVVLPAIFLFGGLIQTGSLAWLGGIMLLLVAVFLGWLLLLSWPVLSVGSRAVRLIVVVAVVGIAIYKFMGRI